MRGIKKLIVDTFVGGFFRRWYRFVNSVDKKAEIIFMNYGYAEDSHKMPLEPSDEINRYPIQLYHQLVRAHDLENKDILEIGCGRGGGLAFLAKLLKPSSAVGIDRDPSAIEFCNNFWGKPGLSFMQGDAQAVSLPDNSFDVIINVESSHRYEDVNLFLEEVRRLLRPNGIFLLTDFRGKDEMPQLLKQFGGSGLQITGNDNVTPQVVKALELDDTRRRNLVKNLVPRLLHRIALDFAGAKGSPTYRRFASGKWIYFNYFFRKVPALHVVRNEQFVWENRDSSKLQ
ncbi:MAG: class I SAM-dependent methyltransferase [Porphyromonadaceae bacterium]|nr:MAG: class I SAM-dependent methyltransferase [Porphyromonadaceae bacterium]